MSKSKMQWNLYRLRKEAGVSRSTMARILKISESAYSKKERGENSFLDTEMFAIRAMFGGSMEDIFLNTNCIDSAIMKGGCSE